MLSLKLWLFAMSRLVDVLSEAERKRRRRVILGTAITGVLSLIALVVLFIVGYVDSVRVQIEPLEAAQSADIQIGSGYGFVFQDHIVAIKDDLAFQVSAEGFIPQQLEIRDATWRRGRIDLVMRERLASLRIATEPQVEDVEWYIDGVFVEQNASLVRDVLAGNYEISTSHPYFLPATVEIALERGKEHQQVVPLQRVAGRIKVTSEPDGAEVTISNGATGETMLETAVEGGEYKLEISKANFVTLTDSFKVTVNNPQVTRHYVLPRATSEVQFRVSPPSGVLMINNQVLPVGRIASKRLPVNSTNTFRYSQPGFRSQQRQFTVKPDTDNRINIQLEQILASVLVVSDPPQAVVSVNGKEFGSTPLELNLPTIPHKIVVSADGYDKESRTVTPKEGKQETVAVELKKQHKAVTRQSFASSIGFDFKLFNPRDTFRMGTVRGDPQRRPNEFVRQVSLTRPFYASIHEVTAEQFQKFSNPAGPLSGDRRPVTNVTWIEAAMFCNWLSVQEKFEPVYQITGNKLVASHGTANGYRLLTEAEWEWLARKAGHVTERIFPWGDQTTIPPNSGNLADESAKAGTSIAAYIPNYNDRHPVLAAVGQFSPSRSGLHDLGGNVSEWVHDSYSHVPPPNQAETDPFDTSLLRTRVVKGPSWRSAEVVELRVAYRWGTASADDAIGFRVARYPD